MPSSDFELAGGGTIGRDHRIAGKNYQDGVAILETPDGKVAIVTDGCGSSQHSEVGALLSAPLLCESIMREVRYRNGSADIDWQRALSSTLSVIDLIATQMGGSFRRNVENYFLFTVVGVLLADQTATFFALGDGVIVINGERFQLGPFPLNQPPYASYGLLGDRIAIDPAELRIKIIKYVELSELENFLLGCDGLADLIDAEEKLLPGLSKPLGPLSQFWEEDSFFSDNPDLVSRRLRLAARDWPKREPIAGLLPDDTTLVVGRRIKPLPAKEE